MQRVKIGVVGCGNIAQVQHLPFLSELAEEFEVSIVCDVSASLAKYVANWFHVPKYVTDYRDVLNADVDCVLLCHADPKTEIAVASLKADKHLFVEKPMCYSLEEVDAVVEAAQTSGKVAQAGYMKLYEPAFELAQEEVSTMDDIRFVQVNHLHPNNELHVRQFRTRRFDDIPTDVIKKTQEARKVAQRAAIGDVPPHVETAFRSLTGSMIHDLYGLRVLFGVPNRVVSTDIWAEGKAYSTTLEYPEGYRCLATWVDLPELWDFQETLGVYGANKRIVVDYGTGFSRKLSTITIQEIDQKGHTVRRQPELDWESPFRRELRHFYKSIVTGTPSRSPVESARDDTALIIDIIKAYLSGGNLVRSV